MVVRRTSSDLAVLLSELAIDCSRQGELVVSSLREEKRLLMMKIELDSQSSIGELGELSEVSE